MKKIDGYPHNGYPTDIGTGTGQIIQRVGYGGATTRTLPAPLTPLIYAPFVNLKLHIVWAKNHIEKKDL